MPSQLQPIPPHEGSVILERHAFRRGRVDIYIFFYNKERILSGSSVPFFVKLVNRWCYITHMCIPWTAPCWCSLGFASPHPRKCVATGYQAKKKHNALVRCGALCSKSFNVQVHQRTLFQMHQREEGEKKDTQQASRSVTLMIWLYTPTEIQ